jgi:type IV secretory pathway TraG/TraD family ATPase VirD4
MQTNKKQIFWDWGGGLASAQDPTVYRRDGLGATFCATATLCAVAYGTQLLFQNALHLQGTLWEAFRYVQHNGFDALQTIQKARFATAGTLGLLAALPIFQIVSKPRNGIRIKKGREFFDGNEAIAQAKKDSKAEIKNGKAGIFLNPKIQISEDRETKHVLISGGVGSGKTVVITQLLSQLFARQDRALIVDWKGDFTQKFKGFIFNPFDQRSVRWAIGRDCETQEEAKEFATSIVPEPKGNAEPFFVLAAQAILTTLIIKLQKTKPKKWTWSNLYEEFSAGHANILQACKDYQPHAVSFVGEDANSKQTQSVLATVAARMSVIEVLARADEDSRDSDENTPVLSINEWLASEQSHQILIAGVSELESICRVYMRLFFTLATKKILGLEDGQKKKIWVVCDEFPNLGKVESIPQLIAVGRSKNARVVLACQDFEQIKETYGANIFKSLLSMVSTKIICKTAGSETSETIAKTMIGMQTIERRNITRQSGGGTSQSWSSAEQYAVHPSELESGLGVAGKGIFALLLGLGNGVHRLYWNFQTLPNLRRAVKWRECFKSVKKELKTTLDNAEVFLGQLPPPSANLQNMQSEDRGEIQAEKAGEVLGHVIEPVLHSSALAPAAGAMEVLSMFSTLLHNNQAPAVASHKTTTQKAQETEIEIEDEEYTK